MSTLTEIEAAADALPPRQREQLLKYLTESLRQHPRPVSSRSRALSEFSGVVRLAADPVDWQSSMRDEWR